MLPLFLFLTSYYPAFLEVMVTHCALSAQHIQRFAKDDPFVYVGDFNIKPDSSMYQLLTQGSLDTKVSIFLRFWLVSLMFILFIYYLLI